MQVTSISKSRPLPVTPFTERAPFHACWSRLWHSSPASVSIATVNKWFTYVTRNSAVKDILHSTCTWSHSKTAIPGYVTNHSLWNWLKHYLIDFTPFPISLSKQLCYYTVSHTFIIRNTCDYELHLAAIPSKYHKAVSCALVHIFLFSLLSNYALLSKAFSLKGLK